MASPSNVFFNNLGSKAEQSLIEELIVESISIYGHRVHYCPRTIVAKDEVYGEDSLSTYNGSYSLDLYVRSYDSYEGDGSFLSKFNLEIRDQITFSLARRTFDTVVGSYTNQERPLEGDLIYSDIMKRLFVVKYVNHYPVFFQMGTLQTWDVVCEVFEYSNERLNTGVTEIDNIQTTFSADGVTGNTEYEDVMSDVFATNQEFEEAGQSIIDWSDTDPFSDGNI